MAKIKTLMDINDTIIYPQTIADAIYINENQTLNEILGDIINVLAKLNDGEGV